jgi:hypothetical protein
MLEAPVDGLDPAARTDMPLPVLGAFEDATSCSERRWKGKWQKLSVVERPANG